MPRRRSGATSDLEELQPGLFLVHNPAAGPTLRGEGEREGDRFRLTSWRREGLLARLRGRGFLVETLADQIAALPGLPPGEPPGELIRRPLAGGERISHFAAAPPGWAPAPQDGAAALLRDRWVIRRRRGRGPASYYRVTGPGLAPLGEEQAVLAGYAQVAAAGPAVGATPAVGGLLLLPDLPLPAAHRVLLGRFAERAPAGWLIAPEQLGLAELLLARLGVGLGAPQG